jgi:hypothetical protein
LDRVSEQLTEGAQATTETRLMKRFLHAAVGGLIGCLLTLNSTAASTPSAPPKICIEGDEIRCETKPTLPVGTGKIKWHPGNYMMPDDVQIGTHDIDISKLASLKGEDSIQGAKMIVTWGYLEGGKGDYSRGIAKIKEWLAVLTPINKHLVVEIITRRYTRDGYRPAPGYIVPLDIEKDPAYNGGIVPMFKGFAARIWEKQSMDRLIALYQALGKEFDGHPNFEAVLTDETALGYPDGQTPKGWSQAEYATQFKRLALAAKKAFPHTNVITQSNFLGSDSDLAAFIKYCHDNQIGIGGPDIMHPPHSPLQNARVIVGGVDGFDYRYKTPIGFSQEVLTHKSVSFTPPGVHDYGFNGLGANYIFWAWHTDGTAEQNWKTGVLPYLRGLKTPVPPKSAACPSNLKGRCDPS